MAYHLSGLEIYCIGGIEPELSCWNPIGKEYGILTAFKRSQMLRFYVDKTFVL